MLKSAPFDKYAGRFLTIEDEEGNLSKFVLNDAQKIVYKEVVRLSASGRPIRILILKGRQQGMSTFCQMYLFWRCHTRPGTRALTVGHVLPAVHDLYRKFERAWKELANDPLQSEGGLRLQPDLESGGEKGRRMLFADPLRSTYRADSATEPEGIGRGGTFSCAHFTEIPQWSKPAETMQAALAAIPDSADSAIFVETTAKGASGWFYEAWIAAIRQVERGIEPEFTPVFVPWFKTKRYRRARRKGEPTLDKRERAFRDDFKLDDEQVYWYRDQRQRYGDRVTEEFPSTWQEAFLSSGLPYFRQDALNFYKNLARSRIPIRKGAFVITKHGNRKKAKFTLDDFGPTRIYVDPEEGHRYSVGIDFASGRASDSSAIVVWDIDAKRIVAVHHSKWLPDDVLTESVLLARTYNLAFMVPERSGLGITLVDKLVNEWGYSNVYRDHDPIAVKQHGGARFGFATSVRTRSGMLESFAHLVHTRAADIPDDRLVDEMHTFVYVDEEGQKAAAASGTHDDLIMATAIAIEGSKAAPFHIDFKIEHNPSVSSVTGY